MELWTGGGGWQGVRRLDKDVFRDLPVTGSSHDIPKCFLPLHPSVLEFLRRITADPAIPYPSSAYFHPSADGRTECNHASSAMIYAFCRAGITLRVHARPRDLPLRMYRYIYYISYVCVQAVSQVRVDLGKWNRIMFARVILD